jgi:hypothetical protein
LTYDCQPSQLAALLSVHIDGGTPVFSGPVF